MAYLASGQVPRIRFIGSGHQPEQYLLHVNTSAIEYFWFFGEAHVSSNAGSHFQCGGPQQKQSVYNYWHACIASALIQITSDIWQLTLPLLP
jgi:hypothetical protein